jgi:hypothetical protein
MMRSDPAPPSAGALVVDSVEVVGEVAVDSAGAGSVAVDPAGADAVAVDAAAETVVVDSGTAGGLDGGAPSIAVPCVTAATANTPTRVSPAARA